MASENVSALGQCDFDDDHVKEMIVATEDQMIRAFKGEEIIFEIKEQDTCCYICEVGPKLWGYILNNGHIGVYKEKQR